MRYELSSGFGSGSESDYKPASSLTARFRLESKFWQPERQAVATGIRLLSRLLKGGDEKPIVTPVSPSRLVASSEAALLPTDRQAPVPDGRRSCKSECYRYMVVPSAEVKPSRTQMDLTKILDRTITAEFPMSLLRCALQASGWSIPIS